MSDLSQTPAQPLPTKTIPPAGPDPLGVTHLLPGQDRVYAFLRLPPSFEMPLRDVDPATGRPLGKWCGLHALWLACQHLWPEKWNVATRPPASAKSEEILGLEVPNSLAWTALRVGRAPSYFAHHHATMHVDGVPVRSYGEFFRRVARSWLRRPLDAEAAEEAVTELVRANHPVAIDVPLRGFFREHVMFVYGVCHEGFVVVDSVVVPDLPYRKLTPPGDPRLVMLLPFEEFRRRWGRGGSVWHVVRDGSHQQRLLPRQEGR